MEAVEYQWLLQARPFPRKRGLGFRDMVAGMPAAFTRLESVTPILQVKMRTDEEGGGGGGRGAREKSKHLVALDDDLIERRLPLLQRNPPAPQGPASGAGHVNVPELHVMTSYARQEGLSVHYPDAGEEGDGIWTRYERWFLELAEMQRKAGGAEEDAVARMMSLILLGLRYGSHRKNRWFGFLYRPDEDAGDVARNVLLQSTAFLALGAPSPDSEEEEEEEEERMGGADEWRGRAPGYLVVPVVSLVAAAAADAAWFPGGAQDWAARTFENWLAGTSYEGAGRRDDLRIIFERAISDGGDSSRLRVADQFPYFTARAAGRGRYLLERPSVRQFGDTVLARHGLPQDYAQRPEAERSDLETQRNVRAHLTEALLELRRMLARTQHARYLAYTTLAEQFFAAAPHPDVYYHIVRLADTARAIRPVAPACAGRNLALCLLDDKTRVLSSGVRHVSRALSVFPEKRQRMAAFRALYERVGDARRGLVDKLAGHLAFLRSPSLDRADRAWIDQHRLVVGPLASPTPDATTPMSIDVRRQEEEREGRAGDSNDNSTATDTDFVDAFLRSHARTWTSVFGAPRREDWTIAVDAARAGQRPPPDALTIPDTHATARFEGAFPLKAVPYSMDARQEQALQTFEADIATLRWRAGLRKPEWFLLLPEDEDAEGMALAGGARSFSDDYYAQLDDFLNTTLQDPDTGIDYVYLYAAHCDPVFRLWLFSLRNGLDVLAAKLFRFMHKGAGTSSVPFYVEELSRVLSAQDTEALATHVQDSMAHLAVLGTMRHLPRGAADGALSRKSPSELLLRGRRSLDGGGGGGGLQHTAAVFLRLVLGYWTTMAAILATDYDLLVHVVDESGRRWGSGALHFRSRLELSMPPNSADTFPYGTQAEQLLSYKASQDVDLFAFQMHLVLTRRELFPFMYAALEGGDGDEHTLARRADDSLRLLRLLYRAFANRREEEQRDVRRFVSTLYPEAVLLEPDEIAAAGPDAPLIVPFGRQAKTVVRSVKNDVTGARTMQGLSELASTLAREQRTGDILVGANLQAAYERTEHPTALLWPDATETAEYALGSYRTLIGRFYASTASRSTRSVNISTLSVLHGAGAFSDVFLAHRHYRAIPAAADYLTIVTSHISAELEADLDGAQERLGDIYGAAAAASSPGNEISDGLMDASDELELSVGEQEEREALLRHHLSERDGLQRLLVLKQSAATADELRYAVLGTWERRLFERDARDLRRYLSAVELGRHIASEQLEYYSHRVASVVLCAMAAVVPRLRWTLVKTVYTDADFEARETVSGGVVKRAMRLKADAFIGRAAESVETLVFRSLMREPLQGAARDTLRAFLEQEFPSEVDDVGDLLALLGGGGEALEFYILLALAAQYTMSNEDADTLTSGTALKSDYELLQNMAPGKPELRPGATASRRPLSDISEDFRAFQQQQQRREPGLRPEDVVIDLDEDDNSQAVPRPSSSGEEGSAPVSVKVLLRLLDGAHDEPTTQPRASRPRGDPEPADYEDQEPLLLLLPLVSSGAVDVGDADVEDKEEQAQGREGEGEEGEARRSLDTFVANYIGNQYVQMGPGAQTFLRQTGFGVNLQLDEIETLNRAIAHQQRQQRPGDGEVASGSASGGGGSFRDIVMRFWHLRSAARPVMRILSQTHQLLRGVYCTPLQTPRAQTAHIARVDLPDLRSTRDAEADALASLNAELRTGAYLFGELLELTDEMSATLRRQERRFPARPPGLSEIEAAFVEERLARLAQKRSVAFYLKAGQYKPPQDALSAYRSFGRIVSFMSNQSLLGEKQARTFMSAVADVAERWLSRALGPDGPADAESLLSRYVPSSSSKKSAFAGPAPLPPNADVVRAFFGLATVKLLAEDRMRARLSDEPMQEARAAAILDNLASSYVKRYRSLFL